MNLQVKSTEMAIWALAVWPSSSTLTFVIQFATTWV